MWVAPPATPPSWPRARARPRAAGACPPGRGGGAALVPEGGAPPSHTAIVARARSTPAVVGAGRVSEQISPGDIVAVDGSRGLLWVTPPPGAMTGIRADLERLLVRSREAMQAAQLPAVTTDGF